MLHRLFTPVFAASLVLSSLSLAPAQNGPVSPPVTERGIVVGAPRAGSLNLRTQSGILQVKAHSTAQLKEVRGGDLVRVYGRRLGRVIYNANIRILQKKASGNAEDYQEPSLQTLDGNPDTRTNPTPTAASARPTPTLTPARMK